MAASKLEGSSSEIIVGRANGVEAAPPSSTAEDRLRLIVDSTPALIHSARPDGYLDYFNKPWLEYLGVTLDEVIGWKWTAFVHPDDIEGIVARWRTCLATGEIFEYETRVRRADGEYRWMFHRKVPLRDEEGNVVKWYGSSIDIEDRKQAEEALRRSEFYLAEGQRLGHSGSWVLDPSGSFTYWSQELFRIYGLDPASGAPSLTRYLACIHPQDREFMAELIREMLAKGLGCDVKKRIVRPDRDVRYVRCVGIPQLENGILKSIIGTAMDVTDQEEMTQELQRRQAYLAEAQRLSHTGSFGWKPDTGEIIWSDETYRIFEFDKGVKLTMESLVQRVHPEDRADFQKIIDGASAGVTQFEHTYRLLLPDGRVKHVHALAHVSKDASGNREFIGAATDVTEPKRAEQSLRQSEAYLAEAQRPSQTGSWAWSPDRDTRYWSEECYRVLGFDPRDGAPRTEEFIRRIHPDDQQAFRESVKKATHTKLDEEVDYRIVHPDGAVRDIHSIGHPVFSPCGNLIEYTGTVIDITERKTAEEALRGSEAYLAEAQRLSQTGSWAWSPDQDIRYWSDECYRVLSFDPQDGLPRFEDFIQRLHPDDQPGFRELIETAIREKAEWEADYRIAHPDGPVRDIHVVGHPVLSTSGHLVEFVGTVIDITERKRAEEERRRSEMELRQILDFTPQQVGVSGPDGSPLYANRAALEYFGISLDQWRGEVAPHQGTHSWRSWLGSRLDLVHPDDREHFLGERKTRLLEGVLHEFEARLLRHDGKFRWFLLRLNPLKDERGHITRWYGTATDIEDRKRAEERLQHENVALREEVDKASMFEEIVGASPALRAVLSGVAKVAPTDSTVLITGETGTGKELIARAIHKQSPRSSRAFISVNCAAIPQNLIASELFGHEKGAFTGALQRRAGRFELAERGTIFLDEVGDLPAETQVALLRVLQEREFERVGGNQTIRADVRVITATNRDLEAAIAVGTFRSDLFYRLNVFPLEVPPLRDRREDIPILVEYFIDRYASRAGKKIRSIHKKTLDLLQSYPWPGNIRELQNVIERSVIVCESGTLSVDERWISRASGFAQDKGLSRHAAAAALLSKRPMAEEKQMIEAALAETRGRVSGPSGAAAKLGVPASTLESKIRALEIDKYHFRSA